MTTGAQLPRSPESLQSIETCPNRGHVFWFFGLSGAGKTTLATGLSERLRGRRPVLLLDGDDLRAGLCSDLGFSDKGRAENIRRAAELAKLAMNQGYLVLAAFITPQDSLRRLACSIIGPDHVDLVWVDAPLAVCRRRDPKGLYRKSDAGLVPLLTGVDSIFEEPGESNVMRMQTDCHTVDELEVVLVEFCLRRISGVSADCDLSPGGNRVR